MAETVESPLSLLSLEDELTCSICLSPFDSPVTIPCGHNFCHLCILEAWKGSHSNPSCPQCRTAFATQPELRKNTVLSSVVDTFTMRSSKTDDASPMPAESREEGGVVICCDTCMEAEATHTCLTCMASYCEEHLRPHLDNPVFRLHQLSEPVRDLLERICSDHHKLLEFFCSQHNRPICSICLQQVHKECSYLSPEEQRNAKESELRGKLGLLDGKITMTEDVVSEMKDMQSKLKELATNRRKALVAEYQQMRDMLVRAEADALTAVDHELESGQTKLKDLTNKFTVKIESMSKAKEHIHSLLSQSQTLAFLQVSFDLPSATKSDPFTPRISLDSKKLMATEAFAAALKEYLVKILKEPVEDRLLTLKPDGKNPPATGSTGSTQESEPTQTRKQKKKPRSHSPGGPRLPPFLQPAFEPPGYHGPYGGQNPSHHAPPGYLGAYGGQNPSHHAPPGYLGAYGGQDPSYHAPPGYHGPYGGQDPSHHAPPGYLGAYGGQDPSHHAQGSQPRGGSTQKTKTNKSSKKSTEDKKENKDRLGSKESQFDVPPRCSTPTETPNVPLDITSTEKRHELLKYASVVKFNPSTAHRRIAMSEGFTKASLSDEPLNYHDHLSRFTACSQVLGSKGFSRGRHYWEVRLSSNNFIGIGLCYGSIYRKGPNSRLGRNAQSWCVEWFCGKLSAWYNSSETVLDNPNPKRVGVLLDCEAGTATFYKIADRAYPFHSFVFPFAEPLYPAFWIFSSDSSISLCKPEA